MLKPPAGTLTFLMTDIEGSTRLWEEYPAAMATGVLCHEAIIHETVTAHGGYHVVEQGEGDSTLSVFEDATQAALASEEIRTQLAKEDWPDGLHIRVRIGLHSGIADMRQQTYYGRVVNRAARVRAVAHGGQVVLTSATRELLDAKAFPHLTDHGLHRLKDLLQPEHLFELPSGEKFPPFKTLNTRPNNLPVQLTPFVGRAADILNVQDRLAKSRLVTLVGTGGCGKTRLALHVAAESLDRYEDGAFFVDLTAARSLDDAVTAMLRSARAESLRDLEHSEILLIVDNCEHIVGDAARSIKSLLESTKGPAVLATSREALQLQAENLVRVPPLGLPSRGCLDELDAVAASEAVQLFVERASAKLPDFSLSSANCRPVGEICIHLDGIALAIELAVSRLKLLSPEQLLARLDERFKLLKTSDHTETRRHQTLLAAIEHSYDLLCEDERRLLAILGLFRGGWTLEEAEAVAPEPMKGDVLDLLESLYDKSLTNVSESIDGETRSYLLESIRQFALMKLGELGEEDQAYRRLCDWCMAAAADRESEIKAGDPDAAGRLDREMPNVEEVLDWTIRSAEPELGLTLAVAVWQHWSRRGTFTQSRAKLRCLLEMGGASDYKRALGFSILGTLAWYQDDFEEARTSYHESLRLYEELGDAAKIVKAKNNLGLLSVRTGDLDAARSYFQDSLQGAEALGDDAGTVAVGLNLGILEFDSDRPAEARRVLERLLPRAKALDNPLFLAVLFCDLGECDLRTGQCHESMHWLLECAPFFRGEVMSSSDAVRYCLVCASLLASLGQLLPASTIANFAELICRESEVPLTGRMLDLSKELQERLLDLSEEDRQSSRVSANSMNRREAEAFIREALKAATTT